MNEPVKKPPIKKTDLPGVKAYKSFGDVLKNVSKALEFHHNQLEAKVRAGEVRW